MKYSRVENIVGRIEKPIKKKNLHIFSYLFVCLVVFSMLGFSTIEGTNISYFIKRITASWTPKAEDIGKIKFVDNIGNNHGDGSMFIVSRPFKNYYANNITKTKLEVFGLGDVIVLSSIDGVVSSIEYYGSKYILEIVSGDLRVRLEELDNVCVEKNERVVCGQKIAVSDNSRVIFSLILAGKEIGLSAGGVNDVFFE